MTLIESNLKMQTRLIFIYREANMNFIKIGTARNMKNYNATVEYF